MFRILVSPSARGFALLSLISNKANVEACNSGPEPTRASDYNERWRQPEGGSMLLELRSSPSAFYPVASHGPRALAGSRQGQTALRAG